MPYKLSCNCPVLQQSTFSHKSCCSCSATEKYAKWAAYSILGVLSAPAWAQANKENELQGMCMLLTICTFLLGPSGHGRLVSRPPKVPRDWCYCMVFALFCLTPSKITVWLFCLSSLLLKKEAKLRRLAKRRGRRWCLRQGVEMPTLPQCLECQSLSSHRCRRCPKGVVA